MYKFKQKLLIIFKENKVVGLTIILSLILIISLFTYGKNKNNVFKDKYMNNIFIEENVSEIDTNDESKSKDEEQEEVLESVEGVKSNTINLNKNKIVAEIKGEVVKPDVYTLNEGSIIRDLIEAAGGLTPEADISNINRAKELTNIDVKIICGEEESNLGFMGVLEGAGGDKSNYILVLDIGGGSTEFIVGNEDGIKFCKSENVGALRMTEKFITTDPISDEEFSKMSGFIEKTISSTLDKIKGMHVSKLVGIGGAITSLSAMNQQLEVYSMEKVHNSVVTKKDLEKILQNLKKMTLSDKKTIKGLQPKRADIITAGVKILHIVMEKLEIEKIMISEYDNLEGLICQNSKKMS